MRKALKRLEPLECEHHAAEIAGEARYLTRRLPHLVSHFADGVEGEVDLEGELWGKYSSP